jgi:hypothetical protein
MHFSFKKAFPYALKQPGASLQMQRLGGAARLAKSNRVDDQ